eukprot:5858886-Amphidinium_carterae.1
MRQVGAILQASHQGHKTLGKGYGQQSPLAHRPLVEALCFTLRVNLKRTNHVLGGDLEGFLAGPSVAYGSTAVRPPPWAL